MTTFMTTGKKNNGFYLGSILYNNGRDGLDGRGHDEEPKAMAVAEELKKMGWEFAWQIDEELAFHVFDRAEYNEFVEDFKKAKKLVK